MRFSLTLVLLLPVICSGQASPTNYTITGHIKGVNNQFIYLKPGYGPDYGSTDSVFSANGEFTFKGTLVEKRLATLAVEGQRKSLGFILEGGHTQITGSIVDMNNAQMEGSAENHIYAAYKKITLDLNTRNQDILNRLNTAKKSGDTLAYQQAMQQWTEMGSVFEQTYSRFIKKYPSSFAALNICRNHTFGAPELAHKLLSLLSPSLHKHSIYKEVKNRADVETRIALNKEAPDFKQPTTGGIPFYLSQTKGKYVLIDFWASWCLPCRKESPNLVKAYSKYASKGFEIISVSLDDNREKWLKAILEDTFTWTNVSDLKGWKNKVAILYGVSTIPKNFLLDKTGKIIGMNLIGETLQQKLELIFSGADQ